jgi:hypothetical protein
MGQELNTTLRFQGKTSQGKALLETREILFRGDLRLKIPFADIQKLEVKNGDLHIRTKDGLAVLHLGPKAEQWQHKILHPKSRAEKLGVKTDDTAAVLGTLPPDFLDELKNNGVQTTTSKSAATSSWIFLSADKPADLNKLKPIRNSMGAAAGLWIIYPKGVKTITEHDVRGAGLKAGLVDVKVSSFSATHTALKFVIPKDKR